MWVCVTRKWYSCAYIYMYMYMIESVNYDSLGQPQFQAFPICVHILIVCRWTTHVKQDVMCT